MVGTKVLSAKNFMLLLHQLGIFTQYSQSVGEEEFHEINNSAGGRNVMQLARVVAWVIAVMGLEPTRAMGKRMRSASATRALQPMNGGSSWDMSSNCCDLYHLSVQIAEADTVIGEHMQQVPAMQATLKGLMLQVNDVSQRAAVLSNQMVERDQHLELVSDRQDGLHYAILELGGYVRYHHGPAAP